LSVLIPVMADQEDVLRASRATKVMFLRGCNASLSGNHPYAASQAMSFVPLKDWRVLMSLSFLRHFLWKMGLSGLCRSMTQMAVVIFVKIEAYDVISSICCFLKLFGSGEVLSENRGCHRKKGERDRNSLSVTPRSWALRIAATLYDIANIAIIVPYTLHTHSMRVDKEQFESLVLGDNLELGKYVLTNEWNKSYE
jgi:hypothetical protein